MGEDLLNEIEELEPIDERLKRETASSVDE